MHKTYKHTLGSQLLQCALFFFGFPVWDPREIVSVCSTRHRCPLRIKLDVFRSRSWAIDGFNDITYSRKFTLQNLAIPIELVKANYFYFVICMLLSAGKAKLLPQKMLRALIGFSWINSAFVASHPSGCASFGYMADNSFAARAKRSRFDEQFDREFSGFDPSSNAKSTQR